MNYIDFEVGSNVYKLRLNTRAIILLEKSLGSNPLNIFGLDPENPTIPPVTAMVAILHASLQQYNHSITMDKAYDIFDEYLEEHSTTEFIPVIMDIYKASGIIPKDTEEQELQEAKNA